MKEKGAKILIDEKHKGKIGGWSDWRTRMWYAALQTGQDPTASTDMDAAWEAVRKHRDLALKYWASGAELMSLLAEEEIHVTEGWSGRIYALQEQGHDIGYMTRRTVSAGRNACSCSRAARWRPAKNC
jgi:spermidine/putrescine transport system substrate-binding protein